MFLKVCICVNTSMFMCAQVHDFIKLDGKRRRGWWGWDSWMASPTQWTWVWAKLGRQWRTGKPGILQSVHGVAKRHKLVTEQRCNRNKPCALQITDNSYTASFIWVRMDHFSSWLTHYWPLSKGMLWPWCPGPVYTHGLPHDQACPSTWMTESM